MNSFQRQKVQSSDTVNLLDLRPRRCREWEIDGENLVTILVPKFSSRFLRRWLLPRLKKRNFHVRLDAYGSLVWQHCDGNTTVAEIGKLLQKRFGEQVEPVYERLALFFRQLEKSKFIVFE